jgi:hypothetical protein
MYIKIKNGIVVKYPYSTTELISDYNNVSFPIVLTDDLLKTFDVYSVQETTHESDYTKNYEELEPQLSGSTYIQTWNITDASEEEINTRIDEKWGEVRETRNLLLYQSDWTQFQDSPITGSKLIEWQTYRQQLREISSQPNPFNLIWPTRPN